jgi:hypothetical protein
VTQSYDSLDDAGKRTFRRTIKLFWSMIIGLIVAHAALFAYAITAQVVNWEVVEIIACAVWTGTVGGIAVLSRRVSRLFTQIESNNATTRPTDDLFSN